jgi:hypothetical protein
MPRSAEPVFGSEDRDSDVGSTLPEVVVAVPLVGAELVVVRVSDVGAELVVVVVPEVGADEVVVIEDEGAVEVDLVHVQPEEGLSLVDVE